MGVAMLGRMIGSRRFLRLVLSASLAASVVPAVFCGYELHRIHQDVVAIEGAAEQASRARDLVDRVSQSLFNLAAAPLDLSAEERLALFTQTDANLAALTAAVTSARGLTALYLDAPRQAELTASIEGFAHSWEEVKQGLEEGMEEGEKAYHFLNIFNEAGKARDLLMRLQTLATAKVEASSAASIAGIRDVGWMLALVFAFAGSVSTAALIANHRIAGSLRNANEELENVVAALNLRDEQLLGQNERFNAALENMSQGLSMFNRDNRLIVCNARFGSIYGLPAELMEPGTALASILAHKHAQGFRPESGKLDLMELVGDGVTSAEAFATTLRGNDDRALQIVG